MKAIIAYNILKYRKTPNKRPPPINAPPHPRPHVGVYSHVFGYILAENGPIFIP